MPQRRSGRAAPPFPFPHALDDQSTARLEIDGDLAGTGAAPILAQLIHETTSWLQSTASKERVVGPIPDLEELPGELTWMAGRVFELMRDDPQEQTSDDGASTHNLIGIGVGSVADWIERNRQAPKTAAVFYQLALLFFPGTPGFSYWLGRVLRTLALYDQAEQWLHYSADRAARSKNACDREYEALAFSGLGNLKRERGNFPEARRCHRKALRTAHRYGLHKLEGDAWYDLAVMAFEAKDIANGMTHAREAIKAYGPGHSQLLRLANDLAWIWMHLHGDGIPALQLFNTIEPHVHEPGFRAVLLANIARALAHIESAPAFEAAWLEAYGYLSQQHDQSGHAAALGQLALAALMNQQIERTRETARQCYWLAKRRGEHRMVFLAEQILDATENGIPELEDFEALFPGFRVEGRSSSAAKRERDEEFAYDLGRAAAGARRDGAPESPVRTLISGR